MNQHCQPTTCRCTARWSDLVVHLEGHGDQPVLPATSRGPTAHLYDARCRTCGARYRHPWRLAPRPNEQL